MLIRYVRYFLLVFCVLVTAMPAIAEDYKLAKQDEQFYQHLYAWYAQDKLDFEYYKSEFNRYGLLLLQEHWGPTNKKWLEENIRIIRNTSWREDRKGKGLFIPRENVTVYLTMLLEKEGLGVFQGNIVGRPLRYEKGNFIHYLRHTGNIDGGK